MVVHQEKLGSNNNNKGRMELCRLMVNCYLFPGMMDIGCQKLDQPTLGSLPIFAKMVNIGKPPVFTSKNRAENLKVRKIIEKRDSCPGEKKNSGYSTDTLW